ncbi:hypothetical protein GCM10028827_12070 [Mucilaginibacter myungsuensis]
MAEPSKMVITGPDFAAAGTCTTIWVELTEATVAATDPKFTATLPVAVGKFFPVMVKVLFGKTLVGEVEVIDGLAGVMTTGGILISLITESLFLQPAMAANSTHVDRIVLSSFILIKV